MAVWIVDGEEDACSIGAFETGAAAACRSATVPEQNIIPHAFKSERNLDGTGVVNWNECVFEIAYWFVKNTVYCKIHQIHGWEQSRGIRKVSG